MTEPKPRKVAIVARHPKSRYLAPFADDTWEIWTLSPMRGCEGFTDLPRYDRFYELHELDLMEREVDGLTEWITKAKEAEPDRYWLADDLPVDAIVERFGHDYFTQTVAFMAAHAIYEGVDELSVFGCDFAHDSEYQWQRPCMEFWLGVAVGLGVQVYAPPQCDLIKHQARYAYDKLPEMTENLEARQRELEQRIGVAEEQLKQMQANGYLQSGHLNGINEIAANVNGEGNAEFHAGVNQRREQIENELAKFRADHDALRGNVDMLKGCLEENRYHRKLV